MLNQIFAERKLLFGYFGETFPDTDLAPNIKTTGNFVYNVPTDSEGYFLKVGKSGTNEMYRLYGA